MNQQQQETLKALRSAAEQDRWDLYREMLAKLLANLKQTASIGIIAKQAQRFLSDLSRAHPEDERIGRAIESLNDITTLDTLDHQGWFIDSLLNDYWDWPGVSNYRNSFKGISKPEQYFEHSGEYIDSLVSILSGIVIAIETNSYWGGNPEYSQTFFGSDVRKAVFMLARHHSDPNQVAFRVSLWIEIANELEIALQEG